jgi:hypothetical protein
MKLKLGTRVLIEGVETFISELHADITRGVYKVRTSNPTYEFCKHPATGDWFNFGIVLQEAPKYGNYQVGDRVSSTFKTPVKKGVVTHICPVLKRVTVTWDKGLGTSKYLEDGREEQPFFPQDKPSLKKLRVKLGEQQ